MADEPQPIPPDQVPEPVRLYMAELRPHFGSAFVQRHFRQITCLSFVAPDQPPADFFALEFRVGQEAALIWTDGQGRWGAGQWLTLAHPEADLTTPPSQLSLQYFESAPPLPSLGAAIEMLTEYD